MYEVHLHALNLRCEMLPLGYLRLRLFPREFMEPRAVEFLDPFKRGACDASVTIHDTKAEKL